MFAVRRRTVNIVEIKAEWHAVINGALQFICGRDGIKRKLQRPDRSSRDGKQEVSFGLCSNDQDFGASKMCQREAPEGIGFFERGCGEADAAQKLAWRKDISLISSYEIHHRHFAWFSTARPERANTLQGRRKRNHWTCWQRHADVSADGGFVPDLERGQKRTAAFAQEPRRCPLGWRAFYELIKLDDFTRGRNFQSVF